MKLVNLPEATQVARLYSSGRLNELVEAVKTIGGEQVLEDYVHDSYFVPGDQSLKRDFYNGLLQNHTHINLKKEAEGGVRLNIIMNTPRMLPYKDGLAWTLQETLFPHINYVKFSAKTKQMGYYLTTLDDIEVYINYIFTGTEDTEAETEFRARLDAKRELASAKYGDALNRNRRSPKARANRRNGYSAEFASRMFMSVAA